MNIYEKICKKLLSPTPGLLGKIYSFRKSYLTKSKKSHYSQFGEDIILKDWINKNKKTGFYVDVGCYHPKKHSNTYNLYKKGWRGINIDLNRLKINTFDFIRPKDFNVVAAVSDTKEELTIYHDGLFSLGTTMDESLSSRSPDKVIDTQKIITNSLTEIINSSPYKDKEIDVLSVDVEGLDFKVIKSLDFKTYNPKIILIEQHANNVTEILSSDVYKFLFDKGYILSNWVGFTLFFVNPACNFIKHRKGGQ